MSFEAWLAFVALWTLVAAPVGPDAVNSMASAASNGARRAQWTVLGIAVASVLHTLLAAFGFGALLLLYAEAYHALKWTGIAYLVWLGIQLWCRPGDLPTAGTPQTEGRGRLLRRGFLISMSNPKAVLIYVAVLPQFVRPEEPLAAQLLILGPTATVIVTLICVAYTLIGAGLGRLLTNVRRRRLFNRAAGGFYFFTAGALALADPRRAS